MIDEFAKDLQVQVRLFKSANLNEDYLDDKYYFFEYIFSNLENSDLDSFTICSESFPQLNSRVDAYYYDEDTDVHNLFLTIYNRLDSVETINEEVLNENYQQIINFLKISFNKEKAKFGEDSLTFDIASEITDNLTRNSTENDVNNITVTIYSNYIIPKNLKKDSLVNIEVNGLVYKILFRTYDLKDLQIQFSQFNSEKQVLDCEETFNASIPFLKIYSNSDFDVCLFSMRGDWLANLYKNDSQKLLEPNVRSYLKRTSKVNSGIAETVKNDPEEFVCYNNGISAVATNIEVANNSITKIDNFQIVNGGQTTATLSDCLRDAKENLPKVIIPVKLTVVKNAGDSSSMISNISTYSNTQTAIKKSDPPSNLPFYVDIKKLSQQILSTDSNGNNYICYFERTTGEYDTDFRRNNRKKSFKINNPSSKKFNKLDLAFAINCWEQYPQKASLGKQNNFIFFNDIIKKQTFTPNDNFFKCAYAIIILLKTINKRVKLLKLSYANNVAYYTLAYLSFVSSKKLDLISIWNNKKVDDNLINAIDSLVIKVHEVILNPLSGSVEPRMWARKEDCWNETKKINLNISLNFGEGFEFFPKNDALSFIQQDSNFFKASLWNELLFWNEKFHVLNNREIAFLKLVRSKCYSSNSKPLTKKQKDYAISLFILAAKKNFIYNKSEN